MSDEISAEDLKMLTLQFMGQHLTGDLKTLEQNIVAKNNTLKGMVLDPAAVLNSIPSAPQPLPPPQGPQLNANFVHTHSDQPTPVTTTITTNVAPISVQVQQPIDQNQLEFNFNTSPLSERIFESLQRIEKMLLSFDERLLAIEDTKKKD
jgi:hypothetical protein